MGLRRPLRPIALAVVGAALMALAGGGVASPGAKASAPGALSHTAAGRPGLELLPVSARSAVSATLGAASRAYVARRSSDGFRLNGGGVAARLDAGGVTLH